MTPPDPPSSLHFQVLAGVQGIKHRLLTPSLPGWVASHTLCHPYLIYLHRVHSDHITPCSKKPGASTYDQGPAPSVCKRAFHGLSCWPLWYLRALISLPLCCSATLVFFSSPYSPGPSCHRTLAHAIPTFGNPPTFTAFRSQLPHHFLRESSLSLQMGTYIFSEELVSLFSFIPGS